VKKIISVLALLAVGFAQEIPKPVGHVNDFAGIIPKEMTERLETKLRAYKTETSNEVSVVTVKSLSGMSVEDYTVRLAKAWGVGNRKKDNGVVFLIAPKERRCRIEVGYGLEPKLTDIQAKRIIESVVIPKFKEGKMPEGIEAGTESIISTLTGKTAPAAAPAEAETGPNIGLISIIAFGVILLVVIVVAVLNGLSTGGRSEWSSSSDWGSIATGAIIGSLCSSSPRSVPRSPPSDDDDDDSGSRSFYHSSDSDSDSGSSFGGFGGGSFGGGGASGSW